MRCWLFFNRDLTPETPEAPEVLRFIDAAKALDIDLYVLKPSDFDLVVDSSHGWSATYQGRDLLHKPDLIIPRCGAETSSPTNSTRCRLCPRRSCRCRRRFSASSLSM